MFAVIFEVQPKKERWSDYLALAKFLKPRLEAIDGFIDNERFQNKRTEGRVLSLSTWRDEKAVVRWRTEEAHHGVQEKGRFEIFADYHLRVGEVTDDSDPPPGLPLVQRRFDETEIGAAKMVTITELVPRSEGSLAAALDALPGGLGLEGARNRPLDHELFESIYTPGKFALLASWVGAEAAAGWSPKCPAAARSLRHRRVRVIRDYGMFERREAPQYYPAIQR